MAKSKESAFWVPPSFDEDGVQATSGIGPDGREYPDPVPTVVELLPSADSDILKLIRQVVHSEQLRAKADEEGFDTPEEADDFADEDDDYELTPYQRSLMERDLNPDPALSARLPEESPVKKGEPVGAPPSEVSKPVGEPGPGSVASSEVGKSDKSEKVVQEGLK